MNICTYAISSWSSLSISCFITTASIGKLSSSNSLLLWLFAVLLGVRSLKIVNGSQSMEFCSIGSVLISFGLIKIDGTTPAHNFRVLPRCLNSFGLKWNSHNEKKPLSWFWWRDGWAAFIAFIHAWRSLPFFGSLIYKFRELSKICVSIELMKLNMNELYLKNRIFVSPVPVYCGQYFMWQYLRYRLLIIYKIKWIFVKIVCFFFIQF